MNVQDQGWRTKEEGIKNLLNEIIAEKPNRGRDMDIMTQEAKKLSDMLREDRHHDVLSSCKDSDH